MLSRTLTPKSADSEAGQGESSRHKVYDFVATLEVSCGQREKIQASPHHT